MLLVILDRDGVINHESDNYIRTVEAWQPIDQSPEAIARLKKHGYTVTVATNQSGVARGYFTQETLDKMHEKMNACLKEAGTQIDGLKACTDHPDAGCDCRKPRPGMLLHWIKHFNADPKKTWFIGDSWADVGAAQAAGVNPLLLDTGHGKKTRREHPEATENLPHLKNLWAAVDYLLEQNGQKK
jgi:D-glycero-D-manno-heptose 1,7-bisphosphate phosphatase